MMNKRFLRNTTAYQSFIKITPLFITTSLLVGCATMSKNECRHADWLAKGQADGAKGALPDYIIRHNQACVRAGVTPDKTTWEKGRQEGLKNYCTATTAYIVGREGHYLSPVCGFVGRAKLIEIEQRYQEGRRMYRIQRQLDDMRREMYGDDRYPWRYHRDR